MSARDQVLATIRRSLGVTGQERPRRSIVEQRLAGHAAGVVPARTAEKSASEIITLFVKMAEESAATVSSVRSPDEAPKAVAEFLRGRNQALKLRRGDDARLADLPWREAAIEVTTGRSFGDDETGVSAAFGAVAETGTLVLVSGPDNPTTLNFLPDNHVVVVDAADLGATYEDLWARLRGRYGEGRMPRTVNWITGPSRSADIEQTLLMGAHGPKRLHIVLIDPSFAAGTLDVAEGAPAGSTPSPAIIRATMGADTPPGGVTPKEKEPQEPAEEKKDGDDSYDEEVEESFPASDPPSSTQP